MELKLLCIGNDLYGEASFLRELPFEMSRRKIEVEDNPRNESPS